MRLIILLCAISNIAMAQKKFHGYYVTNNNDTIAAKFAPDWEEIHKHITVLDSLGRENVFKPSDIKSFQFIRNTDTLTYVSRPTEKEGQLFLAVFLRGNHSNLYFYTISRYNGQFTATSFYYTLERKSGQSIFLGREDAKERKEKIQQFYADDPAVMSILDQWFQNKRFTETDLRDLVRIINQ